MKKAQKISCTVESCKYNNNQKQLCNLEKIMVTPKENVNTAIPEESECSSYRAE